MVYPADIVRGALVVMLLATGLAARPLWAVEQTVTPLNPTVEQRVEPIGHAAVAPSQAQRVEAVASGGDQAVGPVVPPTPGEKAAERTGKVAVGFMAVVLSIAAMAAQIMFI